MKSQINNIVKVLATGFVALLLFSLPLFWGRLLCETILADMMPRDCRYATIQPSGLVPPEIENDPNVVRHSEVEVRMRTEETSFFVLGIADYFQAISPAGYHSDIYYHCKDEDGEDWMYFDKRIGQVVCQYTDWKRMENKWLPEKVQLYAGPEGVSKTADKKLGRFTSPIIDTIFSSLIIDMEGRDRRYLFIRNKLLILYDKKLRRFFKIDFDDKEVVKGPQLSKDNPHEPIQIGQLNKNKFSLYLRWDPPMRKISREMALSIGSPRKWGDAYIHPIIDRYCDDMYRDAEHLLVLGKSGRIDLLDKETLEFAGTAGRLPAPQSLFSSKQLVTPKDLLAYKVMPLSLSNGNEYRGMFVAAICREGTAMTLAIFDEEGKLIKTNYTRYPEDRRLYRGTISSSKAVYFAVPGAPVLTIGKYLLENLHPPILSLISYATADSIEASAGHRALFILPNSFIAMMGRDVTGNMVGRFGLGLLLILPSIILSILLAWRVSEDAKVVGLSENSRLCWLLGTIAFGLPGYITYRLTRPRITLVTCTNCGKLRRPDMDRCHSCGSKWHVPELTPPTWRVIDR